MVGVVKYGLVRRDEPRFLLIVSPGIQVPVEAREIAARYGHSNSVPWLELVAGEPQVDLIAIDLSRLNGLRQIQAMSEPGSDHAV
jgi:hypothetical protein